METRFEITFQDTEEMYCRLFSRLYGKRYMVYAIFFVLFAIWMGYLWLINWEWLYGIMMTVFLVGSAWYMNYARNMGMKYYKQRLEHLRGKEPSLCMKFGEEIQIVEDGSPTSLSYSRVARVLFAEDLLILVMEYKTSYFAPVSRLAEGTPDELIAFLREKCTNAKFKV